MIVGLGIDVVECERIRRALDRHGKRFAERICRAEELHYCYEMHDPVPHLAGRFAAKEAARKALAQGPPLSWHDVEIIRAPEGSIRLQWHGTAAEVASQFGVVNSFVSLAHERSVAVATVVLEG